MGENIRNLSQKAKVKTKNRCWFFVGRFSRNGKRETINEAYNCFSPLSLRPEIMLYV
jgi:hypothetical protein